jgi:hypothetical protein
MTYSGGDDRSRYYLSAQDISSKNPMPGDRGRRDVFRFGGAKTYGIFSADFLVVLYLYQQEYDQYGRLYQDLLNVPSNEPLSALKNQSSLLGSLDGYFNDYFYSPLLDRRQSPQHHHRQRPPGERPLRAQAPEMADPVLSPGYELYGREI